MILGIMQPYFFPYLGHFQLIAAADRWLGFDIVKYKKRSWMNRNRILHPTQGWQYVTVPVREGASGLIQDTRVVDAAKAERRIIGQLDHYRGRAPHHAAVVELVRNAFANPDDGGLAALNMRTLAVVCAYLDLPFDASLCSTMNLDLPTIDHAGQWALEIADRMGAERYVNPIGGKELFRTEEWSARGVDLGFLPFAPLAYDCAPYEFVEGLSILDVLMWNAPGVVADHLRGATNVIR